MPAFARWLIDGDETAIYQLYEQTRSAREERFLPPALASSCNWPRARAFVKQLPRGAHTRREYRILCVAEQFTKLSDRYSHRHPPQLYQHSDAICAIWGALVEEYCQSWFTLPHSDDPEDAGSHDVVTAEQRMSRSEMVSLLHSAGLSELAQEISGHSIIPTYEEDCQDDIEEDEVQPPGVIIGHYPTILHLRGWLATISVRAMALFELLACERRCMPFGCRAGEPYEAYIGYLTPEEVWQLATCLRSARPPDPAKAEADYVDFRRQQAEQTKMFRMLDEVLPTHAEAFLQVVRMASQYGLGLICSMG
jgi:hypothetical protein